MKASKPLPPSGSPLQPSGSSDETYTRLHITPFDQELLKVVLPGSAAQTARNISFHNIETFPEKRYGFVDLPHMEAEKLKKKLNGATLKGTKVRIEKARPEERQHQADEEAPKSEKVKSKKSEEGTKERKKKRKREVDVLEGVELKDRKVKRGWTETPEESTKKKRSKSSKDKEKTKDGDKKPQQRKRIKSKYTDEAECLLNTKIPPNAVKNLSATESASKRRKKDKVRTVTIHEFEKTTKFPSFLKNPSSGENNGTAAAEYVEGKGWVDAEGKVIEEVKTKAKAAPKKKSKTRAAEPPSSPPEQKIVEDEQDSDDTSSSGSSSEDDETSSSSDDATSESESEAETVSSPKAPQQSTPNTTASSEKTRPMSSGSLTIKIPPPMTPSSTKVHPLEALYKKTNPGEAATETPAQAEPFSFFGGGEEEEDEQDEPSSQPTMPMTPFTRQDLEWRNVRSAAPTPDTAHPSRARNFWATSTEEEQQPVSFNAPIEEDADDVHEEDEDEAMTGADASATNGQKTEFQEWFWENRRELNRSWMKRRKTVAKEKRHRDNKARASRVF